MSAASSGVKRVEAWMRKAPLAAVVVVACGAGRSRMQEVRRQGLISRRCPPFAAARPTHDSTSKLLPPLHTARRERHSERAHTDRPPICARVAALL